LNEDYLVRIAILLIALTAAGCTSAPQQAEPSPQQSAVPARHRLLDRGCFDDCMGTNAGKEFCEDRCTY